MKKRHERKDPATGSIPEAGQLLGIGRNAAYDAARRGEIPTIKIGRLRRVPWRKFLKAFELDQ